MAFQLNAFQLDAFQATIAYGQAQADIKAASTGFGQAQVLIFIPILFGQAQSSIKTFPIKIAQTQALILIPPYNIVVKTTAGLLSYWRLDETSGNFVDSGPDGYDISSITGGARGTAGLINDGDGSFTVSGGQRATPGNVLNFTGTNPFSLELWVRIDTVQPYTRIAGVDGSYPTNYGYFLYGGGNSFTFYRINNTTYTITGAYSYITGKIYHLVGTYDGSTLTLYVNGVSQGTASDTTSNGTTSNNFWIGTGGGINATESLYGAVDEVAVYNRALTSNEVLTHYLAGSTARQLGQAQAFIYDYRPHAQAQAFIAGIAAWYKFDDTGGTTLVDSVGSNNVTLDNTSGVSYGVQTFDSDVGISLSGRYAQKLSPSIPYGSAARTVEGWIKSSNTSAQTLISYGLSSTRQAFTLAINHGGANTLGYWTWSDDTDLSAPTINNGSWHHTALTYDAGATQIKIYLDGSLLGTGSLGGVLNTVDGGAGLVLFTEMWRNQNNLQSPVENFRIWNKALTASEIAAIAALRVNIGQAQADILVSSQKYANAQTLIGQVLRTGQAQTQIAIIFTDILGTAKNYPANIVPGLNSIPSHKVAGQAQADIKQTFLVSAQAQFDVKQTYPVFAQATVFIGWVRWGQAQADIKVQNIGAGQSQVFIAGNIYNSTILADSPSGFWPLDDSSGTTAHAVTGPNGTYKASNITYTINAPMAANGILKGITAIPSTYMFTNASDVSNDFSFEVWYQTTQSITLVGETTSGVYSGATSTGTGGGSPNNLWFPDQRGGNRGMGVSVGTNGIQIEAHGDNNLYVLASYSGSISTSWHHLVITSTTRQPKIYLDGVLVRTGLTNNETIFRPTYLLGRDSYGPFAGSTNNAALYPTSLTATQIQNHYNAGVPRGYGQAQAQISPIWPTGQAQVYVNHIGYPSGQTQAQIIAFNVPQFGQALTDIIIYNNNAYSQVNAIIQPANGLLGILLNSSGVVTSTYYTERGPTQPNYDNTNGLPSVFGGSNGGAALTGEFIADETGTWSFQVNVDDGADLWIGNTRVIDAGFLTRFSGESAFFGTISLVAGQHYTIMTRFYQGGGPYAFRVWYKRPSDSTYQYLTDNAPPWIRQPLLQRFAQAQTRIIAFNVSQNAQAQTRLIAFDVPQYGQAQVQVTSKYGLSQVQADIKAKSNGYAQALTFIGHFKHGQALAQIRALNVSRYGQAQSDVVKTFQNYSQAQAVIDHAGHGNAQARILHIYKISGQALAYIIPPTFWAQAQGRIIAFDVSRFGQTQARILTTYYAEANVQAHIVKQQGLGLALAQIRSGRTKQFGQARVQIGNRHFGLAQAIILKLAGYAQTQADIRYSNNNVSGQATGLIQPWKYSSQAQADIVATYTTQGWALALIDDRFSFAQAQADILTTYSPVAQVLCRVKNTYLPLAQSQGVINYRYLKVFAQAAALIVVGTRGYGQVQTQVGGFKYAQAQAKILGFNVPKAGQAMGYILVNINVPVSATSGAQSYLVRYNGYTIPGYAQSESFDDTASINTYLAAYRDMTLKEYLGLSNTSITLNMKLWEETYILCKERLKDAATYLRSSKGFADLYIQRFDAHYSALIQSIKADKVVGSPKTLDYSVTFEAKPWFISNDLYEISGNWGLTNNPLTQILATSNRTLSDGTWTPTRLMVSGADIIITGVTEDGEDTGRIEISGIVENLIIDTETHTAEQGSINFNDRIINKDYELYIGSGVTTITIIGASSIIIQYNNRWILFKGGKSNQSIATSPIQSVFARFNTGQTRVVIESSIKSKFGQAEVYIIDIEKRNFGQVQALIESPIKNKFGQAMGFIYSPIMRVGGQVMANIKASRHRIYAQSRVFIVQPTGTSAYVDLPGWRLMMYDEFDIDVPRGSITAGGYTDQYGTHTADGKYTFYSNTWHDTSGNGQYDPAIVAVANSKMDIFIQWLNGAPHVAAFTAHPPGSSTRGGYASGIRMHSRIRADLMIGYKGVPMMWSDIAYSVGAPPEGELDYPEANFDAQPKAYFHYYQNTGPSDQAVFLTPTGTTWQQWHDYVLEYIPGVRVEAYIDGVSIGKITSRVPVSSFHANWQFETWTNGVMPSSSVSGHVEIERLAIWKYDPTVVGGGVTLTTRTATGQAKVSIKNKIKQVVGQAVSLIKQSTTRVVGLAKVYIKPPYIALGQSKVTIKKLKVIKFAQAVASIKFAAPVSAYYVSTTGSNSNNGISTSTPWQTLQYAATNAPTGSTIYIRAGTYTSFTWSRDNLTFLGYPGDAMPVITNTSIAYIIDISANNFKLGGVKITGASQQWGAGIRVTNSTRTGHGYIDGNTFINCRSFAVFASTTQNVLITNNDISKCDSGIQISYNGLNVDVTNNTMHSLDTMVVDVGDPTRPGTDDRGANGIIHYKTTGPSLVDGNFFYGLRAFSTQFGRDGGAFEVYEARNITYRNNSGYDCQNIMETGRGSGVNCGNISLHHNTFWRGITVSVAPRTSTSDTDGLILRSADASGFYNNTFDGLVYGWFVTEGGLFGGNVANLKIKNNLVRYRTGGKVYSIGSITSTGIEMNHNGGYSFDGSGNYGGTSSGNSFTLAQFQSATVWADNDVQADPLFTAASSYNLTNPDYTLQSGSPMINKGVAVTGITDGYLGTAPDLGANEKA